MFVNTQPLELESIFFLKLLGGFANGVMLGFGGQYPRLARGLAPCHHRPAQSEVI